MFKSSVRRLREFEFGAPERPQGPGSPQRPIVTLKFRDCGALRQPKLKGRGLLSIDSQEVVDLAVSGLVRDAEDDVVVDGPNCAASRQRPVEKRSRRMSLWRFGFLFFNPNA